MPRTALVILLVAACGGPAKPKPEPAATPTEPSTETCCCDYILESGSEEDGTWAENQTYEILAKDTCAGSSGTCVDLASCPAEPLAPSP